MTVAAYDRHKSRAAKRQSALSASGRDIAPLPPVAQPARKTRALRDFRFFLETYHAPIFYLAWSRDHFKVIDRIETAVLRGGLFALAMPRGSGKSVLSEKAAEWSVLCGHRPYACLIGSDQSHAADMLDSIKLDLATNLELAADFPEVCYSIEKLDRIAQRAGGQTYRGKPTWLTWTSKKIVLPTIPGSQASGGIIESRGLTGGIRGMKHQRPDGRVDRPTLAIIDDPQTDESARSHSQCATRERILAGAILGLAGPGKTLSGIMPCTVITRGDLADRFLDRDTHPQWMGERTKMLNAFPTNLKLWEEYAEIRDASFRAGGRGEEATEFYKTHKDQMDAGADVAWPEKFEQDELTGLQHAMNRHLTDAAAFAAECQNEPLDDTADDELLDAPEIAKKTNGRARDKIPAQCDYLTMFVDVHDAVLYYTVAAFSAAFEGHTIRYGTYPKQTQHQFTLRNARRTMRRAHQGTDIDGALMAGLKTILPAELDRQYTREDGTLAMVQLGLVDCRWKTDLVHEALLQLKRPNLLPAEGYGLTASSTPFVIAAADAKRRRRYQYGAHWRIARAVAGRPLRVVQHDANYWKSFFHSRLSTAAGDTGAYMLHEGDHRLLADHLTAEFRVRTEGRGRIVDEWKLKPGYADNHWLDTHAGCCVAASILGATLPGLAKPRAARKRLTLSEIQAKKAQAAK